MIETLVDLPAEVVFFAQDFVISGKRVVMPIKKLNVWRDRFGALSKGDLQRAIAGIVVIASQLQASNPEGAEFAIVQIYALLTALLRGESSARDLMAEGGVDTKRARELLLKAKKGVVVDQTGKVVVDEKTTKHIRPDSAAKDQPAPRRKAGKRPA